MESLLRRTARQIDQRRRLALALLPMALGALASPAAAQDLAQESRSAGCRDANSATEIAICNSPELSQLELRLLGAYQALVRSIGEPEAQRLAKRYLERRRACQGNLTCIAERLLISTEVFRQRSGAPPEAFATLEPVPEIAPPVGEDVARTEPRALEPEPELHLAAQSRPPLEVVPVPPAREILPTEVASRTLEAALEPADAELSSDEARELAAAELIPPEAPDLASMEPPPADEAPEPAAVVSPSAQALAEAVEGAQRASSDGAPASSTEAPFDTPLSWAFMDFPRDERAALQARLQEAGLHHGPAEGRWDTTTLAALQSVASDLASLDVATQKGAADLLDYITSEAFEVDYLAGRTADPVKAAE